MRSKNNIFWRNIYQKNYVQPLLFPFESLAEFLIPICPFLRYIVNLTTWNMAIRTAHHAEAHLKSSKTSGGPNLDLDVSIFVQIFAF